VTKRIILNALALRPGGSGVQTYIRGLLPELVGIVPASIEAMVQADAVEELPPGLDPIVHRQADGVRRAVAGLTYAATADIVHGLNAALPLRSNGAKVLTIHDLAYFDVPWAFPAARAVAARAQVRLSVMRADAIIAVSAFTAQRIKDRFGRDATVTPLATGGLVPADEEAVADVAARYALPDRFVLHVGTIEPRKDVTTLADGCQRAGIPLVLVGARGGRMTPPAGALQLGYVPQEDLAALYRAATIVAYTSIYEGFGLPPLEAMACGAAVVATSVPALVETLGDAAAFVPPRDPAALAQMISELDHDVERRAALASAGRARAAGFSWGETAARTAGVYESLGVGV
jgi:glycosyltransferase involved in cell wall biosynthesis